MVTLKGAVVETGKFLSVSRQKGGRWLYIRDTWNADASPLPHRPRIGTRQIRAGVFAASGEVA